MIIRSLILMLLITTLIQNASAHFKIESISSIRSDSDYINNKTLMIVPVVNAGDIPSRTLYIEMEVKKAFPISANFYVRNYADVRGSLWTLETLDVALCSLQDQRRRYMPQFLRYLTDYGHCIARGNYTIPNASLLVSPFAGSIRRSGYPIITTNEILDADKLILGYDVILSII